MYYFCTLFDSLYLSRGLTMYDSLKEHSPGFHLFIFAFDDLTNEILLNLKLDDVTVISLTEFETDELKKVKEDRSKAEYCWTCTPSVISYVLEKFKVQHCTYIDSDLYFLSDPGVLISELQANNKNVLITEHRYSLLPRLYEEKRAGRFCVQFVTFLNQDNSLKVLDRWRKQCIDWCYARHEDGKFGDQKYLEEWPGLYSNVHILNHPGGGVAPWNIQSYKLSYQGSLIFGKAKKSNTIFNLVFYHFQYVKFLKNGAFDIGWYCIPTYIKRMLYEPYLKRVSDKEQMLQKIDSRYTLHYHENNSAGLKNILKKGIKEFTLYNIMKLI